MRRHWPPRPEALGLAEFGGGFAFLADFSDHFVDFGFQDGRIARHSGVDDDVTRFDLALGWQGKFRRRFAADEVRHAKKAFPEADRF